VGKRWKIALVRRGAEGVATRITTIVFQKFIHNEEERENPQVAKRCIICCCKISPYTARPRSKVLASAINEQVPRRQVDTNDWGIPVAPRSLKCSQQFTTAIVLSNQRQDLFIKTR
jgi:hypothetical protein